MYSYEIKLHPFLIATYTLTTTIFYIILLQDSNSTFVGYGVFVPVVTYSSYHED
ncbi:MAG: hypothetical protein ACI8RD_000194 [Bacillariaceae sp.]|jgi:hypothetical protein